MAYKPTRVFNASPGDYSVDNAGPEVLMSDLDKVMKMFDPTATHDNNEKGGISKENLNFDINEVDGDSTIDGDLEVTGSATIDTDISVGGNATVDGSLNADSIEVETLKVNSKVDGDLSVDGGITVGGDSTVDGDLEVSGEVISDNVTVSGDSMVKASLSTANVGAKITVESVGTDTPTINEFKFTPNGRILNVAKPTNINDVANKDYVDDEIKNAIITLSYDSATGKLTATNKAGTSVEVFDLNVEKIPASIGIVEDSGAIYIRITNTDGTYTQSDVSSLLTQYTFTDGDTIDFTVSTNGASGKTVTAEVKNNSISFDHLDGSVKLYFDNLASATEGYSSSASASKDSAKTSEDNAKASEDKAKTYETNANNFASVSSTHATLSRSYAVGDTNSRSGEKMDNAKYYKEQSASNYALTLSAYNATKGFKESAETSATNASTSETNAKASEDNAKASETTIKAYKERVEEIAETIPSTYSELSLQTNRNTGDIENLYAISQGILYREDTDTATAYTKSVPAGAAPYASVDKVGGMSAKSKNLWDEEWEVGSINSDGILVTNSARIRSKNHIAVTQGTSYFIVSPIEQTFVYFYDDNDNLIARGSTSDGNVNIGGKTIVAPSGSTYMLFTIRETYGNTYKNDVAIVKGTSGAYEPHYDGIHHMAVSKVESVGANLWDEEWGTGGLRNDGSINTGITTEIYSKNPIKLINKSFKVSTPCRMLGVGLDKDKKSLGWINNASSFASGQIITVPDNCVYIRFMTASSGVYGGTYNNNIAVLNTTTPTAYHPHIAPDTLTIPSAIKSLTGYGWGINDSCYNYADFEGGQYVQMVGKRAYQSGDESDTTVLTDMTYTYHPLATPTVTDISNIDNTIKVEPYGSLTFEGADGYEIPTPSKETYIIKLSEVANA